MTQAEAEIALQRVMDCDLGLDLLRVLARSGSVEERVAARLSIDDLLDRRNRLVAPTLVYSHPERHPYDCDGGTL